LEVIMQAVVVVALVVLDLQDILAMVVVVALA
jgi:hypothetical protein